MESYGLLEATKAFPEVQTLVIRGISDMCDGGLKELVGASESAAAFCFQVLSQLDLGPLKKKRRL